MQFQFENIAEFLAMQGHGPYVWISYAVTFAVLAALAVYPPLRRRQLQRELQRQQRIQQRRRQVKQNKMAEPA
ncbi:heme exporter protein CcmD [Microbulbifer magnicolonia]|uniref:heme exporter protein CcmD n=1 Tax=Microbulbifer magnicolonia TaxID=3109744 RepID=UPI002B40FFED|nr:heme exporter protein CcmD [Microbulbifer sp. GG15]